MLGGTLCLVVGTALLVFHTRLRALNESLTRSRVLVVLSTYVIPAAFVVVGVVAVLAAAR